VLAVNVLSQSNPKKRNGAVRHRDSIDELPSADLGSVNNDRFTDKRCRCVSVENNPPGVKSADSERRTLIFIRLLPSDARGKAEKTLKPLAFSPNFYLSGSLIDGTVS
jgi:hypothetical protein